FAQRVRAARVHLDDGDLVVRELLEFQREAVPDVPAAHHDDVHGYAPPPGEPSTGGSSSKMASCARPMPTFVGLKVWRPRRPNRSARKGSFTRVTTRRTP